METLLGYLRRIGSAPSRSYYFIGKDNIPFHTIIWPAMLLGYGGLTLPYDVPANEFMTMGGFKASSSRGNVIWTKDVLDQYGPDPFATTSPARCRRITIPTSPMMNWSPQQ